MSELRIVSFLPSATEMACALGLVDNLVGITHECDYPPEIRNKPVVVRAALALGGLNSSEIDAAVRTSMHSGASLYQVDEKLLQELAPTLILTQNLCQVCAPSGNALAKVVQSLHPAPQILWFTPRSLAGIDDNLRELGNVTGRSGEVERIILDGRAKMAIIRERISKTANRPRVFCMEWVDPVFGSGHWVPEMVEVAGGIDHLSRKGADSVRVDWKAVLDWAPEVLIINPCGFNLRGACEQAQQLSTRPGWSQLPAVRTNRIYAVDANSYFARPGPRVIEGIQLLAHLIHPDLCEWTGPKDAFRQISCCAP